MNQIQIKFKLNNTDAKLPTYGSAGAAGMDVCACEKTDVPAGTTKLIRTGLSVSWSGVDAENYYLRIAPRSGLAYKSGLFVNGGVIDYDYRGEIGVLIYNSSTTDYTVKPGDRIAQMILEKINRPKIIQVDELYSTDRGSGGFGSTGI